MKMLGEGWRALTFLLFTSFLFLLKHYFRCKVGYVDGVDRVCGDESMLEMAAYTANESATGGGPCLMCMWHGGVYRL